MIRISLGSIVEVFFQIDIDSYSPQKKLSELQGLTLSEVEATSENYAPISVPPGGFYLALDTHFQRLFVLFSDPYSLLYGSNVGKEVHSQVRENVSNYVQVHPPDVPNNQRHSEYEQWLIENPKLCFHRESRCGVFHWGLWEERGHPSSGPVITSDTNKVGARLRIHQHDLFTSFRNISYLKRFLLGAIDKKQRDKMQAAIKALPASLKKLWCMSDTECFALRACLVNVLTQPHVDCGDAEWAMISPFGNFNGGEFCIADLGRRFAFQEGQVAGIRGRRLVHFTRKWIGSRICLVSTMHSSLMRQCSESNDLGDEIPMDGNGGSGSGGSWSSGEEERPRKRVRRTSLNETKVNTSFRCNGFADGLPLPSGMTIKTH